ncbi:hypothetical protein KR018_004451, partial [Drosophila ironensis]
SKSGPVATGMRNFLRENRQMVMDQPPLHLFLGSGAAALCPDQRFHNYQLPTAASLARRSGPPPVFLAEAQRRLMGGTRLRISRRGYSEKQIQTEDISDEQFLNAALLKCSLSESGQSRSEGDDPAEGVCCESEADSSPDLLLRRTASNFELGRMPEQRDAYQPGQYTLHRPLGGLLGIVPGGLDHLGRQEPEGGDAGNQEPQQQSGCSRSVRQMAIPEVIDVVDQEDALSLISRAGEEGSPPDEGPSVEQQQTQEALKKKEEPKDGEQERGPGCRKNPKDSLTLLPEDQRLELLEAARQRQSQLIGEYNRLPISMGTLRVRNLKRILEQQLDVVDSDLSVLSQARVFVR